ncbi:transmembrane protein [Thermobifida fusca TM51]|uniref:Transmembrane protein n=1 Tax=Thermobifida fusca TM51 TaxID=1169414 RepID=A0A9P2T6X3_THEFU|nr:MULTISPECIES: DUF4389 domain-containing protein [Thermobifida]EOR69969.1 transmembrane protein [Thermobifida fusca TM51]MBO2530108.1 DUF4389 domain-containing protein [Thermobifida sp.]PPS94988.1 membrane protein [Thermobifida fusca]PZN65827.1 MAG: DUF4389 domain-containing protein [Thermobifida fusca]QOS59485.1 DUF4389 domain-containing protein [Thermobifida fusca]
MSEFAVPTRHYPLHVSGTLDPGVSRWLWLVKWLLAIPHYIVLFFLWIAFAVLTVVAFFAILFTGRYPRGIFDFNVGVLRWSWRVTFYAYGVLGTDRYPPFSLSADVDYPAQLDVAYPQRLSRGLVLVKWWLLAIPHYLVVSAFSSGGFRKSGGMDWFSDSTTTVSENGQWMMQGWFMPSLMSLLVLIAALALLFTGGYPRGIFNFLLGLHRWALRVVAYAALMTDQYPPFRLDQGGPDPTSNTGPQPTRQAT